MGALLDSFRKLYSQMPSGTSLSYISGAGSVAFVSHDSNSGETIVSRDGALVTIQWEKIELILDKLSDGEPLHLDTFLAASGNARTVIETLVAHLPEVGSKKKDGKKHLQAFSYEIHLPGTTIVLDGDDWLSPEWALAVLFYDWDHSDTESELTKAALAQKLAAVTRRSGDSWKMRVENLKTATTGGPFDGGEQTKAKSQLWLQRFAAEPLELRALAIHAFTEATDPDDLAVVCRELNLPLPSPTGDIPVSDLMLALCAKPFAIITGTSGTGKTREAEDFAARFRNSDRLSHSSNVAIVAVGSDWTDNRNLVGFVNHMRTLKVGTLDRPAFQATVVVDLLLSATDNPDVPHILILDEMNLSHVERYFADFLSAMETREGTIQLHTEGDSDDAAFALARFEGDATGVPRKIRYPQNLFVIGTVNVDETTYMFSPKVLDRAHVLEFSMHEENLTSFLENPSRTHIPERVSAAAARRFLAKSRECRLLDKPLPKVVRDSVRGHLVHLFRLLKEGRFEFGYRSTSEVLAFLTACRESSRSQAEWDAGEWLVDFDKVILQKILPRIHGSRVRIGGLIAALIQYCTTATLEHAEAYLPASGKAVAAKSLNDALSISDADVLFPRSAAKLRQMGVVLVQEQFASFIC